MTTTALKPAPFNPVFQLDPYPSLAAIRAQGPVGRAEHPVYDEVWLIVDHALVRQVHSDPRWVKPPEDPPDDRVTFDSAPPDHTRLRKLVQKAFTTRRIERFRVEAQAITDEILDALPVGEPVDLVPALADAMPIEVIRRMSGLPDEFAAELTALMEAFLGEEDATARQDVFARADAYVAEVLRSKRAAPAADLISDLIAARDGADQLTEDELGTVVLTLLVNGAATSTNVIGTGLHSLLAHPDQLALLLARPQLLASAVEEMLRYENPIGGVGWVADEDIELAGTVIPAGEVLATSLQAANRDPAVFTDPDRFDITRSPNPHLTFSHGIHRCLGAELVRMELQVVFGALLRRFPRLAEAEPPTWRVSHAVRGLTRLPIVLAR
ncbi:cytochrome P450 [Actinokineospora sp. NPDC004072]